MAKYTACILVFGTLVLVAPPASAQRSGDWEERRVPPTTVEALPPSGQAPVEEVPAPPETTSAPPVREEAARVPPSGQWVYAQQYGWIWMPYSDAYAHYPPGGSGEPIAFVYHPAHGWTWLAAPWLWGYGPWPYFGADGPPRFAWYGHGGWRYPSPWHYAPHGDGLRGHGIRSHRGAFGWHGGGFRGHVAGFGAHGGGHGH